MSLLLAVTPAPWTVSDELSLAQTAVLFLTGVVLLWYTFETHRMRKASERQAITAEQQATIAQQQAGVARQQADLAERQFKLSQDQAQATREAMDRETRDQIRASRPQFVWRGGASNYAEYSREFQNTGGAIRNLTLRALEPVRPQHQPFNYVDHNGQGKITLGYLGAGDGRAPARMVFELTCTTLLDHKETKRFEVLGGGSPQEIEASGDLA